MGTEIWDAAKAAASEELKVGNRTPGALEHNDCAASVRCGQSTPGSHQRPPALIWVLWMERHRVWCIQRYGLSA